jgi:hypothetical protein
MIADSERNSVNAIVNRILRDHVLYADPAKNEYDGVTINGKILKKMIELIPSEQLDASAGEMGAELFQEVNFLGVWVKNAESFCNLLSDGFCRYSNWASYNEMRSGNKLKITLSHNRGLKWSRFLQNFLNWQLSRLEDVKIADIDFLCADSCLIISFPYVKSNE